MQRLMVVYWLHAPAYTATASIDSACLREFANRNPYERPTPRKQSMSSAFRRGAGVGSTVLVFPTGCGKTVTSLMMGLSLITFEWEQVKAKDAGSCSIERMARLCRVLLVAAPATTLYHFKRHLNSMLSHYHNAGFYVVVWEGMQHRPSDATAVNTVCVWLVGLDDLAKVLRKEPTCAFAACLCDEAGAMGSGSKLYNDPSSPVRFLIAMTATPQAICGAMKKKNGLMRGLFGEAVISGSEAMVPPCQIGKKLEHRDFQGAQIALHQATILQLLMCTSFVFRPLVYEDLQHLMPPFGEVHKVRVRRTQLLDALDNKRSNTVPANFHYSMMAQFGKAWLTEASRVLLSDLLQRDFSLRQLIAVIGELESRNENICVQDLATIQRVVSNLEALEVECPICCTAPPSESSLSVSVCCGHIMCDTCRAQIQSSQNPRCPMCRAAMVERIPISDLPAQEEAAEEEAAALTDSMDDNMRLLFPDGHNKSQEQSTVDVVKALLAAGHRRIVMVLVDYTSDKSIDHLMQQLVQFVGVVYADKCMASSGGNWDKVEKAFNDPASPPTMLLTNNAKHSKLLFGTNLIWATAMVCVGQMDEHVATQTAGRMTRPNPSRNNDLALQFCFIQTCMT